MFRYVRVALVITFVTVALPLAAVAQQSPPTAQPSATPPSAPQVTSSSPAPVPVTLPPEVINPVEKLAKSIETAEKSIQQLKELEGELAATARQKSNRSSTIRPRRRKRSGRSSPR